MGSEGDARGIGAAAKKRGEEHKHHTKAVWKKKSVLFLVAQSSVKVAISQPHTSYTKMPPQMCRYVPHFSLGELVVNELGRTLSLRKVF